MTSASSTSWPRRLGILGGLGPFAHVEFERLVLDVASRYTLGPAGDQDFPPWVLASVPQTPDRTTAILRGGQSPVPALVAGLRSLSGADFAVIVCNTAHWYIDEIRRQSPIPLLDIVQETVARLACQQSGPFRVGLLATPGTIESGLYQRAAARAGAYLAFTTPAELPADAVDAQQHYVTELIYGDVSRAGDLGGGIKGGAHMRPAIRQRMQERMETLLRRYNDAGIHQVVLGCTELSVAFGDGHVAGVRLIDPLRVASEAAVAIAAGVRPLPGARDETVCL